MYTIRRTNMPKRKIKKFVKKADSLIKKNNIVWIE